MRPTKLNHAIIDQAVEACAKGLSVETVAGILGVNARTFSRWMDRGDRELKTMTAEGSVEPGESEALYVEFYLRVTQARAQGVQHFEEALSEAVKDQERGGWRVALAWLQSSPVSPWNEFARARNKFGAGVIDTMSAGGMAQDLTPEQARQFARAIALDKDAMEAALYLQSILDRIVGGDDETDTP